MSFLFCYCSEPYEPKPVLYSALNAVRGHSAPMDLVRVETKTQVNYNLNYFSFVLHTNRYSFCFSF